MKLEILTPLPAKYRLRYVIEVEFMYGDADHFKVVEFTYGKDEQKKVVNVLIILQSLKDKKSFYYYPTHNDQERLGELYEEWPYDVDADRHTYLYKYQLFFYDTNGLKCKVKVTK